MTNPTGRDELVERVVAENIEAWGWGPIDEIEGLSEHDLAVKACRAGYDAALATIEASRNDGEIERLREALADAERFRALMRCPRIKMQGSAGVNPKTGELLYAEPGSVHFGAEFWPAGEADNQTEPTWGRHCLRALADDILAVEARSPSALSHQKGDDHD